jgi:hypothetical protein
MEVAGSDSRQDRLNRKHGNRQCCRLANVQETELSADAGKFRSSDCPDNRPGALKNASVTVASRSEHEPLANA